MSLTEIQSNPKTVQQPNGLWLEVMPSGTKIVYLPQLLSVLDVPSLHVIAKAALGLRSGVLDGVAKYSTVTQLVFTAGAEDADMLLAANVVRAWGSLVLTVDGSKIRCNDAAIASDTELGYCVYYNGQVYATGVAAVTAGSATVLMGSGCPDGEYTVYLYRQTATFASGKETLNKG